TAIGGLTEGATYTVEVDEDDPSLVRLIDGGGEVVDLDASAADWDGHRLELANGKFKLAASAADAAAGIALDLDATRPSGDDHRFYLDGVLADTIDPSVAVDSDHDTITFAPTSGLAAGDAVQYQYLFHSNDFEVSLSANEEAAWRAYFQSQDPGATPEEIDASIQTLVNKRTAEYHTLHQLYGQLGDLYDANFAYQTTVPTETFGAGDVAGDSSIDVGEHDLVTGQAVVYHEGSAPIAGLVDGE